MNKVVQASLTTLFQYLADEEDGGGELPEDLHDAYLREMRKPEMEKFYGELIELRHKEVFGD